MDLALVLAAEFRGLDVVPVSFDGAQRLAEQDQVVDLAATLEVGALPRSTIAELKRCAGCGRSSGRLLGAEERVFARVGSKIVQSRKPRLANQGLYVAAAQLVGVGMFDWGGLTYCTGAFRDALLEYGATNVLFLEVGDAV